MKEFGFATLKTGQVVYGYRTFDDKYFTCSDTGKRYGYWLVARLDKFSSHKI